ncbi:glyoxalase/bleomycin resistance/dioxygenase family protein [Streptomyces sp. NPDC088812]|uniref:glyoxalase/bleomycin resistance/dioxygenase family protein n=1 Tax=Streptomyces sp. NPDC088812 TaxID=3365905 RepID=UPI00381EA5F6
MITPTPALKSTLLVIYCEALEECHRFYAGLGLPFVRERHGSGPEHYAAVLDDGLVIELYPATSERVTCTIRLGFTVDGAALEPPLAPGRHLRKDPEGRTVELHVSAPEVTMNEPSTQDIPNAVHSALGADADVSVQPFSSGAVAVTIHQGGRTAVIDAHPPLEWAVSVDPADTEAFSGHDHAADSLEDALDIVRRAWGLA